MPWVQVLTHAGSWHLLHPTLFGLLTPQSAPGGTCNLETSWWAPCDVPCPSCHPYQNFESHKVCLHSFFWEKMATTNGHQDWSIHAPHTDHVAPSHVSASFAKPVWDVIWCHAFWGFQIYQICFQGFSGCISELLVRYLTATSTSPTTSSRIPKSPNPLGFWAMAAEDAPPGRRDAGLGANRKRMGHPAGQSMAVNPKQGSLNVPIEHHPTIRYMVYNGYYKVMSNIPKMGHLPTPAKPKACFRNVSCIWK